MSDSNYSSLSEAEQKNIRETFWKVLADDFYIWCRGQGQPIVYSLEQIKKNRVNVKKLSDLILAYAAGSDLTTGLIADRVKLNNEIQILTETANKRINQYYVERLLEKLVEP